MSDKETGEKTEHSASVKVVVTSSPDECKESGSKEKNGLGPEQRGGLDLAAVARVRDMETEMEMVRGINPDIDTDKVCRSDGILCT